MPEMTMALQVNLAHTMSRTTINALSTASTDGSGNAYSGDITRQYVNIGVREFAQEAKLSKQDFVTVTPKFWVQADWYAQLTIVGGNNALAATNVALASEDLASTSGSTLASHIASNINAMIGAGSIAVGWDDRTWRFSICDNTVVSITAVTIAAPSTDYHIDGTEKVFGKTGTDSTSTWVSSFPEDCTLESDLPSDFLEMEHVDYDGHPLREAPFDMFMAPESYSTWPDYYAIRGNKIYIAPVPSDRRILKVRYKYMPTDTTITGSLDTTTCPIPIEAHMAPVYYAAGLIQRANMEHEESDRWFTLYYDQIRKWRIKQANQNPKMFPRHEVSHLPVVDESSLE